MELIMGLAWLHWNPPRYIFTIPWLERPIAWYGVLFVLGFVIGYFLFIPLLTRFLQKHPPVSLPKKNDSLKEVSIFLTERLCWFIVAGTVIGARLGEVFFYDWPYYSSHPLEIFKVWKGGLASHGGSIGIIIALLLYVHYIKKWVPDLTFLALVDRLAIPIALAACFIRLGNFVNQEILGTFTTLPWAVIFGDPLDGSQPLPRHPVQLYEAGFYFTTFCILGLIWLRKGEQLRDGILAGLMLIFIFTGRFILEFWKETQHSFLNSSLYSLHVGQLLSIPFIGLGLIFFFYNKRSSHIINKLRM